MKERICVLLGTAGACLAGLFGGWDASLGTLLLFMGIDYITGAATAVCGKSPKSESGRLSSKIGWRGLVKKCVTLLLVLVAVRLDLTMGTSYLRDGVCIAFSCNELLSIVENAGLLGVSMPELLKQAIDILQRRGKE